MRYWQVKARYDGRIDAHGNTYIAHELYTDREVEKNNLNKDFMTPVEVKPADVYWSFGARFMKNGPQTVTYLRATSFATGEVAEGPAWAINNLITEVWVPMANYFSPFEVKVITKEEYE